MTILDRPLTGTTLAKAAWEIDPVLLATLTTEGLSGQDEEDIRGQLALWATMKSTEQFASFADAWHEFTNPPGAPRTAVYLPGSICERCRSRRFNANDLARAGYANCPQCHGTGRKRPRAIPARPADMAAITAMLIDTEQVAS